ncbi:MAG: putative metal-binding motif-containing protein [Alphaproteobacteria bacterium]|nr:putative metal-binding motif-containing protein [Alphaproteobacteria bacterium]
MTPARFLVLSLALACKNAPTPTEEPPPVEDLDGDGANSQIDCDDGDPDVFPGNPEVCDGKDNDCDTVIDELVTTTFFGDNDGDGYGLSTNTTQACEPPEGFVALGNDCNDANASVNPGEDELCDGIDHDCDGSTTANAVDAPFWYADADGDGYGVDGVPVVQCDQPQGRVDNTLDCDDGVAGAYPGAPELCNTIDDDCDGSVDEDPSDGTPYYVDGDQDGFGAPGTAILACAPPPGTAPNDLDCDDLVNAVNPEADEVCGDSVDNDCNGTVDDGAGQQWFADVDGDGYGAGTAVATGCSGPPDTVAVDGDCDDLVFDVNPGATEICNGIDDDCANGIDDGVTFSDWYVDEDGDGFGYEGDDAPVSSCADVPGSAPNNDDCDDTTDLVSPLATEVCNGADDDCDGVVPADEVDGDGDEVATCEGDCDDTQNTVHPGAVELCDGLDNDCDPLTTDDDSPTAPLWYPDVDGDLYGDDNAAVQACTQPADTVGVGGDCEDGIFDINPGATDVCGDGIDNDCNNFVDDTCIIDHCGEIAADETWAGTGTHRITCNIEVRGASNPTLTIEDGARVVFGPNTWLRVGQTTAGSIDVQGTDSGVLFTSQATTQMPGDYYGLQLQGNASASSIEGLTIEYAGFGSQAGLLVNGGTHDIIDSTFRYNLGDGLRIDAGSADVSGSTFDTNTDYGIDVSTNGTLGTFATNTLTGNLNRPMRLPVSLVAKLDSASTFAGNADDVVHVTGNTLATTATWHALDVPLYFPGSLTVAGPLTPVLTLEDGLTATFGPNTGLYIGNSNRGKLVAQGATSGVRLTGVNGTPGSWYGLNIAAQDQGSQLTNLTVEYAGAGNAAAIIVSSVNVVLDGVISRQNANHGFLGSTLVTIRNSSFLDNAGDGVHIDPAGDFTDGATGVRTFSGNVMSGNGGRPLTGPAVVGNELDTSSTFSGNDDDTVMLEGDTLTESGTWVALDVPYAVNGTLTIQGPLDPVITIADGVEMQFDTNSGIDVAQGDDGGLLVNGATNGVLFTSGANTPAPGDWYGLRIGSRDLGSELTNTTLEYAGFNRPAIGLAGSSPVLDGVTVQYAANDGLDATTSGAPLIRNSAFIGNAGFGVDLAAAVDLGMDGVLPGFANVRLDGNDRPLRLGGNATRAVADDVIVVNNNDDAVDIHGGTVTGNARLRDLGVPWRLIGDLYVQGPLDPTITLDAGVVLEMAQNVDLRVGTSADGSMTSNGTAVDPVLITAAVSPASPGYWGSLDFGSFDLGSTLTWTTVEYGGQNGTNYGAIEVTSDALTLDHVTSRNHANNGLRGSNATVSITNSTFSDNAQNGMLLDGTSVLLASSGNSFENNAEAALSLPAQYGGVLQGSDVYGGNGIDAVLLSTDYVETTQTWQALPIPYRVIGEVYVRGSANPTLTIEDGAVVEFADNVGMQVANGDDGKLVVDGHTVGVTFTTSRNTPVQGAWRGLTFGNQDLGSSLLGAFVEYGGGNAFANVYTSAPLLVIEGGALQGSSHHGLFATGSATVDMSSTTLSGNAEDGLRLTGSSSLAKSTSPTFVDVVSTGNTGKAVVVFPEDVRQLDASSSFAGNGGGVAVSTGTVTTSGLWQTLDAPLEIEGTVNIRGPLDPIVTIEDGNELQFASNVEMVVGNADDGGLVVDGHTDGVLFTARNSTTPGAWRGISFYSRSLVADFLGTVVEYGGNNSYGNLYASSAHLVFVDGETRYASADGIRIAGGSLEMTGSASHHNAQNGVNLNSSATLAGTAVPAFTGNDLHDNSDASIVLPAAQARQLATSSSFANNNGDPIVLTADTVATSGTWLAQDEVYRLDGGVSVRGAGSPVLTLGDGVQILVNGNHYLDIGNSQPGGLVVAGSSLGVSIASVSGVAGSWRGISAYSQTTTFDVVGLDIADGGSGSFANFYLVGIDGTLENVTSTNSASSGVQGRSSAVLDIFDSTFADNNDYGVYLDGTSRLVDLGGGTKSFANNQLTGNTISPILLNPEDLRQLDPSSGFTGNGRDNVDVVGGTVATSGTWSDLDVDYRVVGNVYVRGALNPIVTVEPGVRMEFDPNLILDVGNSNSGGLVAVGTTQDPIVFTSTAGSPTTGFWYGLYFGAQCIDASVDLQHIDISFGGISQGLVRFSGCDGNMSDSSLSYSQTAGIYRNGGANPTLDVPSLTFSNITGVDIF